MHICFFNCPIERFDLTFGGKHPRKKKMVSRQICILSCRSVDFRIPQAHMLVRFILDSHFFITLGREQFTKHRAGKD